MLWNCLIPGLSAIVLSAVLTPLVRWLALRTGLVDAPDGYRKLHGRTVALGGGVAVFFATGLASAIALLAGLPWATRLSDQPRVIMGVACGAWLICFIGLIDDRLQLRGRQKLLGQVVASMLVISGGVVIQELDVLGWHLELGLLAIPFTVAWLIGCVNALNLIDGVDGLATTVGVILSTTIAILAGLNGNLGEAAMGAILAGSLLGFLIYNWPPAKIFLGDSGSMFIGLALGVLAIRASLKGAATVALVAPTAIWAIPILDVGVAILRRKLTGQSIYATDRGHLHHVLQRHGLGSIGTVLSIAGLCMICGAGALASVTLKSELTAMITCGGVVALLIATRSFGHAEFRLFLLRLKSFLDSFQRLANRPTVPQPQSSRFHGNRELEQAWDSLVAFAERFDLCALNFNVNAPMLGEVFHARWERREPDLGRRHWESELPIVWNSHEVGRLRVTGVVPLESSPFLWAGELMEALKPFELQILEILGDTTHGPTPQPSAQERRIPPLSGTAIQTLGS